MLYNIKMHKSAFKYHEASSEVYNSLAYSTALKRALELASLDDLDLKKTRSLDKSEETSGLYDIFSVQRAPMGPKEG